MPGSGDGLAGKTYAPGALLALGEEPNAQHNVANPRTLKRSRSRNGGRWPIQTSRRGEPSQGVGVPSVVAGGARGGGGAGGAARRASSQAEARGPVPVAASSGSARSVPWVSSTARTLAVSGAPTTDDT
jgi:hypothetical protein